MNTIPRLECILSNDIQEIKQLVSQGFCPVECSIDGESIVDALQMDHHGTLSHLEGVALRAYRDLFGARAKDPRFVVSGKADADTCFCIAALAGLIPSPLQKEVYASKPRKIRALITRDLFPLAETINRIDVDPIGVNISELPYGDLLLIWNNMNRCSRDSLGLQSGVGMWRNLLHMSAGSLELYLKAAKTYETNRGKNARKALKLAEKIGEVLFMEQPRSWGFDVWYGRKSGKEKGIEKGIEKENEKGNEKESEEEWVKGAVSNPNSLSSWANPVVVAYTAYQRVTIGCPNQAVAEKIFGRGGLMTVFPELDKIVCGWGGREAICGSPRGVQLSIEQARMAVSVVNKQVTSTSHP